MKNKGILSKIIVSMLTILVFLLLSMSIRIIVGCKVAEPKSFDKPIRIDTVYVEVHDTVWMDVSDNDAMLIDSVLVLKDSVGKLCKELQQVENLRNIIKHQNVIISKMRVNANKLRQRTK